MNDVSPLHDCRVPGVGEVGQSSRARAPAPRAPAPAPPPPLCRREGGALKVQRASAPSWASFSTTEPTSARRAGSSLDPRDHFKLATRKKI